MSEALSFYFFGSIALLGGVNLLFCKNPVHGALFLVCSFLAIAGLFLGLNSGLLAAIQVMVYAGAIMVLFLFVILLLNLEVEPHQWMSPARVASALVAITTIGLVLQPFLFAPKPAVEAEPSLVVPPTAPNVAEVLFRQYALPFEVVSLLLLVSMVGAIHLARRPQRTEGV